jgi:CubicO group peptidase (beta-lactamase class C family)
VVCGYGFGLVVEEVPGIGTMVGHGGGLPGYGSHMRWLPSRGIGVVGLSNTRYARIGSLTYRVLVALEARSLLPARNDEPSAALLSEPIVRLVELLLNWSDEAAETLFADNVELDDDWQWRRESAARLLGGSTPTVVRVEARTSALATAHLAAGETRFELEVLLGPGLEPRIAWYELRLATP